MHQRINGMRLGQRIDSLSAIGRDPTGGITRPFGSNAERQAREWFKQEAVQDVGLTWRVDAAANMWAIHPGQEDLPMVAAGSHLDTVPHGGALDGAAGVLMALEAIQSLKENGYPNRHPLAVLVFTAEEPNPFELSTLGSRLLTGRLAADQLMEVTDGRGTSLADALERVGGNLTACGQLNPHVLSAFIEPHIEQGARLDRVGQPLSAVQGITAIYRDRVTILGEQNHGGTTRLVDRHDALLAFADAARQFEELLAAQDGVVGTIGQADVYPNAINIVPSRVHFVMEMRSPDREVLHQRVDVYHRLLQQLSVERGVAVTIAPILDQPPSTLDAGIREVIEGLLTLHGVPTESLYSLAGHDATHMARVLPSGMLFVRSIGGKSHCADEASHPEDLVLGAEVLAEALVALDQTLQ